MFKIGNSIAQRLTVFNLVVSGIALLFASAGFFAYDLTNSRRTMLDDLAVQAQIIGYNCVTPLVFNDAQAAEKTLAALQASSHVTYGGIYSPQGSFFAGYWRNTGSRQPLPLIPADEVTNRLFRDAEFAVVQPIIFDRKTVGTVYIRSDVQALRQQLQRYLLILLGILTGSLATAFLVSRMSRRAIAEPIAHLAETAQSVSKDRNYAMRAQSVAGPDEITVLVKAFNDMLAEIQARTADLQESERQFRTLADSVPQMAWMAEADGSIFWYNERWYDYTGTTPEQMKGWGWQSVHDPNVLASVLEKWRRSLDTGQRFEMVFPLRDREGNFRDFLTLVVPVRDSAGKVVRWFGTNTDITDQRRSEEALRKSEKLAATGRLAATIAHEINNPLEALANLLYLAEKDPSQVKQHLAMADQELDRIAEITKQTLGFYRDSSRPVRTNISETLDSVLRLYERKLRFKEISVQKRYGQHLDVFGFPGEIRQIFANLIANAIEASPPGGRLILKTSHGHDGRNDYSGVRVSIMDNGAGIDPGQLKRIFEPFYTTKKDTGTGLGLWLTQTLIEKHRGSIRVRSRNNRTQTWTVFSIFLPDGVAREQDHPQTFNGRTQEN